MPFGYNGNMQVASINANQQAMEDQQYEDELRRLQLQALTAEANKASGMVQNEYGGWVPAPAVKPSKNAPGGGMPPPVPTGTGGGAMPAPMTGGGLIPTGGTVTSTPMGGTGQSVTTNNNLQSQSEQLRYDPWAEHRGAAGDQLAGQMGNASPSDFYQNKLQAMASGEFNPDDPSYQWRFKQGQQAVERSAAARGLLNSGNAAIELQQYGQGAASQEYGAQFNRMLQGLAGVETAYDAQMGRLMKMAGVDIDPTAGGKLNVDQGQLGVQQGQLGIDAGRLGLAGQQLANQWALGNRELDLKQKAMDSGSVNWNAIFTPQGGASASYAPVSWDAYFQARDASNAASRPLGITDSGGNDLYRSY